MWLESLIHAWLFRKLRKRTEQSDWAASTALRQILCKLKVTVLEEAKGFDYRKQVYKATRPECLGEGKWWLRYLHTKAAPYMGICKGPIVLRPKGHVSLSERVCRLSNILVFSLKDLQPFALKLTLMATLQFPFSLRRMFWTVGLGIKPMNSFWRGYHLQHDFVSKCKYPRREIKEWQARNTWFPLAIIMTQKQEEHKLDSVNNIWEWNDTAVHCGQFHSVPCVHTHLLCVWKHARCTSVDLKKSLSTFRLQRNSFSL